MPDNQRPRLLIIGVGNSFRGDDATGLMVARLLKAMRLDFCTILEHSGEGASLMETWKGAAAVILVDAVNSGKTPGTIHRLSPGDKQLPAQLFHSSTHAFSLPDAIEMARALNELPPQIVVFGIEGHNFQAGTELSSEVSAALPEVANQISKAAKLLNAEIGQGA